MKGYLLYQLFKTKYYLPNLHLNNLSLASGSQCWQDCSHANQVLKTGKMDAWKMQDNP
jgi:hypothetical protein